MTANVTSTNDPHAAIEPLVSGVPLSDASYALVLVHGRGGSADGMLPIARTAGATDAALIAPRAVGGTWYPDRFLAPMRKNEPYLSSALASVGRAVKSVIDAGIPAERIILVGFSQGACLTLEFAARHAQRLGGVAALAGALVGDDSDVRQDAGDFAGTPILLACGDVDDHIAALIRQDVDGTARTQLHRDEVGDGGVERREVDVGRPRKSLARRIDAQPVVGSEVDARDREDRGDAVGGDRPVPGDRHPDRPVVESRVSETGRQVRPRSRVAQALRRQRLEEARAGLDGRGDAVGQQRGTGETAGDTGDERSTSDRRGRGLDRVPLLDPATGRQRTG